MDEDVIEYGCLEFDEIDIKRNSSISLLGIEMRGELCLRIIKFSNITIVFGSGQLSIG